MRRGGRAAEAVEDRAAVEVGELADRADAEERELVALLVIEREDGERQPTPRGTSAPPCA
jgi:hypothetical protein